MIIQVALKSVGSMFKTYKFTLLPLKEGKSFNFCFLAHLSRDAHMVSLNRNDPKFLDILVKANSADPDQTAPRGAV